jgi:hypothetical protein
MASKSILRCLSLAAVILFMATVALGAINITVHSATHIEMDTPIFHVVAQNGNFTFAPFSSDPLIAASRYVFPNLRQV